MVAKTQIGKSGQNRAGVPLARAQRLNGKVRFRSRKMRSPLLLGAIGSLAILGGGATLISTTTGAEADTAIMAPDLPRLLPATAPPTAEPQAVQLAAIQTGLAVPNAPLPIQETPRITVAAPLPPEPLSQPVLIPTPELDGCVARIENRLDDLHQSDINGTVWDIKRDLIRSTVQAVLDCELASITFEGDVELVATGLADLRVTWDRDLAALTLQIIDPVSPEQSNIAVAQDGQPIAFIVH